MELEPGRDAWRFDSGMQKKTDPAGLPVATGKNSMSIALDPDETPHRRTFHKKGKNGGLSAKIRAASRS